MKEAFFRGWLEYFEWNSEEPDTFPWQARETLSDADKARIGPSMAAFQLGENSEGSALLRFSQDYGERMGFAALPLITAFFVQEERNHSALLGRFMDKHGIPRKASDWTDSAFRLLRKPFGFEVSISVLITAELIALVYYKALRDATSSRLLKSLCNKILEDEKAHVEYEASLIRFAQASAGGARARVWRSTHWLLFSATIGVVYREHKAVLKGGGYPWATFRDACREEFRKAFPESAREVAYHGGTRLNSLRRAG
jgi:hypothetical protein